MNISKAAFAAMICGMVLTACNNDDDITENKGTAQPDDTPKECVRPNFLMVDNGVLTIIMPKVNKDEVKKIQRQIDIA